MTRGLLSPQQHQALTALRVAGGRGVHTFDLRHAGIGNPSQRLDELSKLGCVLRDERERLRGRMGKRFWLVSAPASLTEPVSESPPSTSPPAAVVVSADGGGDSGTGQQLTLGEASRAA